MKNEEVAEILNEINLLLTQNTDGCINKARWLVDELLIEFEARPSRSADLTHAVFYFGKYKGKTVAEVAMTDGAYLEWVYKNLIDAPRRLRTAIVLHLGYKPT